VVLQSLVAPLRSGDEMIGNHPTRAPAGFKPFIYFLKGKWYAGSSWLMCEKKCKDAREFTRRLNDVHSSQQVQK
jgi:hypothetical protein